jgi:hypothetical protein
VWAPNPGASSPASQLFELAILAAAPVEEGVASVCAVDLGLTLHTAPHAGKGLAPFFRDGLVAVVAEERADTARDASARALDLALDGGVDLILNGAVLCPARGDSSRIPWLVLEAKGSVQGPLFDLVVDPSPERSGPWAPIGRGAQGPFEEDDR